MAPSKSARILKRTAVGSLLGLGLATTLWLTSRSSDGRPVLVVAAIMLLAVCFEVSRMGALATHNLRPVLFTAAAGVLTLGVCAMSTEGLRDPYAGIPFPLAQTYSANLAIEYGFTALIAAAVFAALAFAFPRIVAYAGALIVVGLFVSTEPSEVLLRLTIIAAALAVWVACTLPVLIRRDKRGRDLAIAVGLALWIVPPLPALWVFWHEWGTKSLVALLVLSKIGDTFGYYVGNAFGKSHPFPKISPGKTTAGCVGSLLGATATGGAMAALGLLHDTYVASVAGGMVGGAIINVAAQAGDLLESWVKRRAGVKDSSTVFGPSGGVLDQVDSLLLTVPVASLIWALPVGAG